MTRALLLPLLLAILFGSNELAAGQSIPIGGPVERYLRINNLSKRSGPSWILRDVSYESLNIAHERDRPHPWSNQIQKLARMSDRPSRRWFQMRPYHPSLFMSHNGAYPFGQNDGALWQGRGLNSHLQAGVETHVARILEIRLRPEIHWVENRDFALSPHTTPLITLGLPYPRSAPPDLPQRMGTESFSSFHSGQSLVQLHRFGLAFGFGTQNIWSGPTLYNPLVLSNNASGFPHFYFRTTRPIQTPAGKVEGRIFWGELHESDHYNVNHRTDRRFTSGMTLAYSPWFHEELTVGFTRNWFELWPEDGITWSKVGTPFLPNVTGRTDADDGSQYATIFFRWVFPNYGMEVWGEWGLNDGRPEPRMLPVILEHSRAYNLGFQKRFDLSPTRWLVIDGELTHLEHDRTLHSRSAASGIWYEHSMTRQGWTHRGQLLGAGMGLGSNNQRIQATLYEPWGYAGLSIERVELHNDKLRRNLSSIRNTLVSLYPENPDWSSKPLYELQTTEFQFGLHLLWFLPHNLELQTEWVPSRQENRYHIPDNTSWNHHLSATIRYHIPGGLR